MSGLFKKTKTLLNFLGPNISRFFLFLIVIGLVYFLIEMGFAYALQFFLVSLGVIGAESLPLKIEVPSKGFVMVGLVILGALRAFVYYLKTYYANVIQQYFVETQRKSIFENCLRSTHLQESLGVISANFSDVTTQTGQLVYYLANLVVVSITAILLMLYGLYLAPIEMLSAMVGLAILVIPLRKINQRIHHYGREILQEWAHTNNFLVTGIRNNFYLKVSGAIDSQIIAGSQSLEKYRSNYIHFAKVQSALSALPLFIGVAVIGLVSFLSVKYIHTPGVVLLSFFYVFMRMSQMTSEATSIVAQVKLNKQYFLRLVDFNSELSKSKMENKLPNSILNSSIEKLELKNVGFSYQDKQFLFEDLNLKLKKNNVIVIKGESGAGKSTLLALLLGMKVPSKGKISFNDSFSSLSPGLLAYVGPEPYLVPDTIRQNLIFANPLKITDEKIWEVLAQVDLAQNIRSLPKGLDEVLTEEIAMSTGEKQRLAIARSFLREAEVFVFDEATANLDSVTEKHIISQLKKKFANKIAIVVTHKDSFDELATQFLRISDGRVSLIERTGVSE